MTMKVKDVTVYRFLPPDDGDWNAFRKVVGFPHRADEGLAIIMDSAYVPFSSIGPKAAEVSSEFMTDLFHGYGFSVAYYTDERMRLKNEFFRNFFQEMKGPAATLKHMIDSAYNKTDFSDRPPIKWIIVVCSVMEAWDASNLFLMAAQDLGIEVYAMFPASVNEISEMNSPLHSVCQYMHDPNARTAPVITCDMSFALGGYPMDRKGTVVLVEAEQIETFIRIACTAPIHPPVAL